MAHVNDVSSQGMPHPYITDNDGGENGSGLPLAMVPSLTKPKPTLSSHKTLTLGG